MPQADATSSGKAQERGEKAGGTSGKRKAQPALIQLHCFAATRGTENYLLRMNQAASSCRFEAIAFEERIALPVDQCVTAFEQIKKTKTAALVLLQKFEKTLYGAAERSGEEFHYDLPSVDGRGQLQRVTWSDEAFHCLKSRHQMQSTLVQLEAYEQELTKLSGKHQTYLLSYNSIDAEIKAVEKLRTSSLLTASLAQYVNANSMDDYFETDYFKTCLLVIPKSSDADFLATYSGENEEHVGKKEKGKVVSTLTLNPDEIDFLGIVPSSARLLHSDEGYCLYSVILLKRDINRCLDFFREKKWTVREYIPDELAATSDDRVEFLRTKRAEREKALIHFTLENLQRCIDLVTNLALLEIHTEGELRFGQEFDSFACIAENYPRKAMKQAVTYAFGQLLSSCDTKIHDADVEAEGAYLPFIYTTTVLADEAATRAK
ncbi:Vacuolar ATP synthase subunit C [Giardia muris]|uniref:V-type proton ATPase subunit C n=1 Tax=Giardia muris TaxID=5742 RepID=A0A4Z1T2B2_GIAMU|nr:Vacuolar ATP synthase subunit C [Giardia muris]|eukprot:TNJ26729.1 Vacuolar ATP synthase subunit C [Giardia muris]